jgi:phosphoserine phosphatase RsbU/P
MAGALAMAVQFFGRMETVEMAAGAAREAKPVRILLADDQADILDALQLLLKPGGYQTKAVSQPSAVAEALRAETFDLLLIDLNYTRDTTSGGEGLDLLAKIRSIDENVPVLVMTAWSTVDLAVEAMRRGASDFVQKPWQNRRLLEKIEEQVERHRSLVRRQRSQDAELREAHDIQQNLLPKTIPQVPRFAIAASSQPFRVVGGDYYDVVRIGDTQTAFAIGDVAGKGLPAALLMSNVQAALRPLMLDRTEPQELCRRLNQTLCDVTLVGKFVSFFYCVLDGDARRLTYCNAGHNPPLLIRAGGKVEALTSGDAVLGLFLEWRFSQRTVELNPADALVLFTDGVVEACGRSSEPFGEERLVKVAQQNRDLGAERLHGAILAAASEHCGGHFQDDVSLVVLQSA